MKAIKLDTWENGLLKVMSELGNNLVNRIYLAKADVVNSLGVEKATPDCSRLVISRLKQCSRVGHYGNKHKSN